MLLDRRGDGLALARHRAFAEADDAFVRVDFDEDVVLVAVRAGIDEEGFQPGDFQAGGAGLVLGFAAEEASGRDRGGGTDGCQAPRRLRKARRGRGLEGSVVSAE